MINIKWNFLRILTILVGIILIVTGFILKNDRDANIKTSYPEYFDVDIEPIGVNEETLYYSDEDDRLIYIQEQLLYYPKTLLFTFFIFAFALIILGLRWINYKAKISEIIYKTPLEVAFIGKIHIYIFYGSIIFSLIIGLGGLLFFNWLTHIYLTTFDQDILVNSDDMIEKIYYILEWLGVCVLGIMGVLLVLGITISTYTKNHMRDRHIIIPGEGNTSAIPILKILMDWYKKKEEESYKNEE